MFTSSQPHITCPVATAVDISDFRGRGVDDGSRRQETAIGSTWSRGSERSILQEMIFNARLWR